MVDRAEELLGDEVYHYHSKMILKDPKIGGAWTWHQDYGYWYQNGLLYPDMLSVFIGVDKATRENGCLQVIKGSHHMGRIDHVLTGDQAGADMERVNACLERMELLYCEMEPGDALFFHSNLLHRSDQNTSEHSRWSMVCCYNTRQQRPLQGVASSRAILKLNKVNDAMIKQVGAKSFEEGSPRPGWIRIGMKAPAAWMKAERLAVFQCSYVILQTLRNRGSAEIPVPGIQAQ
jgi:ectoine hydroxylase